MLQATYKSAYVFYVSTEDRRYDTSVVSTEFLRYLFKFTNNMDGRVVYAYGQDQVVFNRYTKVDFTHNTTENVFTGKVNYVPNGYWNYKVYEVSSLSKSTGLSCATAPISANGDTAAGLDTGNIGSYAVTNSSGTAISEANFTGKNDVYGLVLSDLDAGTYISKITDGCDVLVNTSGFLFLNQQAQSDDTRWLEITGATQTATGTEYTVVSNMPVGHSYGFTRNYGGAPETQITNITSKPQTTTHTLTQYATFSQNLVELEAYDQTGGAAGGGATVLDNPLNLNPITNPSSVYGFTRALYLNPVSTNSGGTVLDKGNMSLTIINGTTSESTTQGYWTLQGIVEQGKLYVSEPSGEEQVQYTQNPTPSGSNYIWYGQ